MKEWFLPVTYNMSQNSPEIGLVVMWSIWDNRNVHVHQGKTRNGQTITLTSTNLYQEYSESQQVSQRPTSRVVQQWSPPPTGFTKVNFDESLSLQEKIVGVGVADLEGYVLGAFQTVMEGVRDPLLIEAIAAMKALEFNNIILEGDSQSY
ncbi:hypothetical protein CRYUN_Cryun30bG0106800 [Craigia yunnanensis]